MQRVTVAITDEQALWLAHEAVRIKPTRPNKSALVSEMIAERMAAARGVASAQNDNETAAGRRVQG